MKRQQDLKYTKLSSVDEVSSASQSKRSTKTLCSAFLVSFLVLISAVAAISGPGRRNDTACQGSVVLTTPKLHVTHSNIRHYGPFHLEPYVQSAVALHPQVVKGSGLIHHLLVTRAAGSRCISVPQEWHMGSAPGEAMYRWASNGGLGSTPEGFLLPFGYGFSFRETSTPVCLFVEVHFDTATAGAIEGLCVGMETTRVNSSFIPEDVHIAEISHNHLSLEAGRSDVQVCVSCVASQELTILAIRNHGHMALSKYEALVFSAQTGALVDRISTPVLDKFATVSPRKISAGDRIELHCHYNTTGRLHSTTVGLSPEANEMCNQYFLYSANSTEMEWGKCHELLACDT